MFWDWLSEGPGMLVVVGTGGGAPELLNVISQELLENRPITNNNSSVMLLARRNLLSIRRLERRVDQGRI